MWGEKEQRGETRGPIDFRASLVFSWSLNCCPHSPFPISNPLLSLSPHAKWLVSFMHVRLRQWGGGGGRVEVEVVTAPVGD